jgi:DNA polymerase elongation subunit (family B)
LKPILTMDFETDPFVHKKRVYPFACGLYNGRDFDSTWGSKCAEKMVERLKRIEPSIIYMHNGGRFDIFFLMPWLESTMRIINGRIVQCWLGKHEIRDSYAIMPFALAAYKKDEIDITHLERECRQSHRIEILSYLRGDCVYLHELVSGFLSEFGDFLTIGSASMNQLRKFHPFETTGRAFDEKFRKTFFYGGRVQCFKSGIINQEFKIYDVNSMYPFVMRDFKHPAGSEYEVDRRVTSRSAFVIAEGTNRGAFPLRSRTGIDFASENGTYACTIHEWEAAEETGFFKPSRVLKTYGFTEWHSFGDFVNYFFNARVKAKREKDRLHELYYKYVLNSAYGKFAQNPDNFQDFQITHKETMPAPWVEHIIHGDGDYVIWKKGTQRHSYYHVGTGASITGAARAVLMRAIHSARDPVYVDTDSIICDQLHDVRFSDTELGAWKLEASGDRIAMAGKKLYACFDGDKCIKQATKGARISPDEITRVAQGETVTFRKEAPTFKLDGRVVWIERKIKRTI